MSENQQPHHDPLEEAIRAFQGMPVCERPPDQEMLSQLGIPRGDLRPSSGVPVPSKRSHFLQPLVASAAASLLLVGGSALVLRNSAPPEPVPATATDLLPLSVAALSDKEREDDDVLASLLTTKESLTEGRVEREGLRRKSLEQRVAEAEVIVVAQALDFASAPPNVPGDASENFIRFRVKRVLKGELVAEEIKTRTPTPPGEFIGHEWIVMLSPENVAGKHFFAGCYTIKVEPKVKAILAKDKK